MYPWLNNSMKTYTPAQIEGMEKAVMAYRAEQFEAARLAQEAHLANIKEIASSDAYKATLNSLREVQDEYASDESVGSHLMAVVRILDYLAGMLGVSVTAEPTTEDVQPLPVEPSESNTSEA